MSQRKIDPRLSQLPPRAQAYSKGTATNLPEKEFFCLSFYAPKWGSYAAVVPQTGWNAEMRWRGRWGPRLGRDDHIHARPLSPRLALHLSRWVLAQMIPKEFLLFRGKSLILPHSLRLLYLHCKWTTLLLLVLPSDIIVAVVARNTELATGPQLPALLLSERVDPRNFGHNAVTRFKEYSSTKLYF